MTPQQRYMARKRAEGGTTVTVLLDKADARKLARIAKQTGHGTNNGATLRHVLREHK